MGAELDHQNQYQMLREEILDQVRETRRLENYTLGALAYWLLLIVFPILAALLLPDIGVLRP